MGEIKLRLGRCDIRISEAQAGQTFTVLMNAGTRGGVAEAWLTTHDMERLRDAINERLGSS